MKKFMKSLVLVAVAAMGFASCSNNFEDVTTSTETFSLTIESEKPALESDSRTEFNDGSIIWTENDQIRACYYHSTGVWSKYYASTENAITDGGAKATFTGINTNSGGFPAIDGGTYTFYAGYPKTAIGGGQTNAPTNGELSVVVPTEQTMPKLGTFDADADVMVGVSPEVVDAPATTISVVWTRLVAHGCVTLKNLAAEAGETVYSVTFTAPEGVNLTGTGKVNFTAQTMTALNNNTVTVALPANTEAKTAELPVWFCSAPATIASGANFTVAVETTRGTYTRTITANANGIKFLQNRYNTLGINMASAEFTPAVVSSDVWAKVTSLDEITDGTYVIVANDYYCPNNVTEKPQAYTLTSANVSVDGNVLSGNVPDKMKWTFTGTASGMVITKFAGSEQLYATNTNNGIKVGSSDDKTWIASGSNGEFMLVYQLDEPRCLTLYNAQDWRCYKTSAAAQDTQVRTLTLYKLQNSDAPAEPRLSLAQTEIEVEAAAGTATVGVNYANLTEDINVTPESGSWITSATISGNTLSFDYEENDDVEERTAKIVVASGDLSVTLNITQKGIVVVPENTATTTFNMSAINPSFTGTISTTSYNNYEGENAYWFDNADNTNIALVFLKGTNNYAPNFHGNYKNTTISNGNKMIVEGKKIVKIEFTFTSSSTGVLTVDNGAYSNGVWTGESNCVTFTGTTASTYITNMVVTYVADSEGVFANSMNPELSIKEQPAIVPYTGGNVEVVISTRFITENIVATENADWITNVAVAGNKLTFTVAESAETKMRNADITLSANGATTKVTVNQAAKPSEGGNTGAGTHYVKVTEAPADWSGKYLIVYENSSTVGYVFKSNDVTSKNNYTTNTVIDGGEIEAVSSLDSYAVEIAPYDTGYSVKSVGSSKYLQGKGSSTNGTDALASPSKVTTFTLQSDGTVSIVNNTNHLVLNTQGYMRFYKSTTVTGSSYKRMCLYKLN